MEFQKYDVKEKKKEKKERKNEQRKTNKVAKIIKKKKYNILAWIVARRTASSRYAPIPNFVLPPI